MGVVIVNPNPVFDRTITVAELVPGAVMRTLDVELTAGGKGINVARVLRTLGQPAPLIIPVGSDDRARYAALLRTEGADATIVDIPGPVRIASIYLEQASSRVTVVNDAGHPLDEAHWSSVRGAILARATPADIVLIMGSFPPGVDPQNLHHLIDDLHAVGARVLLDVNPHWLAASLSAGPEVVTPNLAEAEAALADTSANVMDSGTLSDRHMRVRAEEAALQLCARGAVRAFVTAGASGVAMAHGDSADWVPAPVIDTVSTVGAGDSFVAGLAHAWSTTPAGDDVDWVTALTFGIATASSSCEHVRAGGIDAQRVRFLAEELRAGARS